MTKIIKKSSQCWFSLLAPASLFLPLIAPSAWPVEPPSSDWQLSGAHALTSSDMGFALVKLTSNLALYIYSETCVNGHLYSETTCIKRPLRDVPKESA